MIKRTGCEGELAAPSVTPLVTRVDKENQLSPSCALATFVLWNTQHTQNRIFHILYALGLSETGSYYIAQDDLKFAL